jgi:membrane-associated HD superfamily phosphohydrolase
MTPKKIEQMINDIFEDRLKDGQLNETDMTIKEINTVKENLIDGLMSIYHSRLSYTESNSKTKTDLEAKVDTK